MDRDLDSWNPMELDYRNPRINSYREGIGQDLQHRDLSDLERSDGVGSGHRPVGLYITNIPLQMDETVLENLFQQHGKVIRVSIPTPSAEKTALYKSKIGFVTMDNTKGAQAAIENLNGFLIRDKKLTVQVKLSKEELARRKEQRVREAEFLRGFTTVREDGVSAAAPSNTNSVLFPSGPMGTTADRGASRSKDAHGDPSSVDITVQNGTGRRVQGGPHAGSGHPLDAQYRGSAAAAVSPAQRAQGRAVSLNASLAVSPGHPTPAPSVAGSDEGQHCCAFCQRAATQRCRACRSAYYCNTDCQAKHWPVHRRVCVYEQRTTAPPSRSPLLPNPDFEHMEVDVSDDFIANNQEYLKEWLHFADARSDSSSSSGGRWPAGRPQFISSGGKKSSVDLRPKAGAGQKVGGKLNQSYPPEAYKHLQGEPVSNREQNHGDFNKKRASEQMQPQMKNSMPKNGRGWSEQSPQVVNVANLQEQDDGRGAPEQFQQGITRLAHQGHSLNHFQPRDAGKEGYQQKQPRSEQFEARHTGLQRAERRRPDEPDGKQRSSGTGLQLRQEGRAAGDRASEFQLERSEPGAGGEKRGQFQGREEARKGHRQQQQDPGRKDGVGLQQGEERGKRRGGRDPGDPLQQQRGGSGAHRAAADQRDRWEQPRREGPGPRQRRRGPNQHDGPKGEGSGSGQRKSEGEGDSFQQHSPNKPGQFQQKGDRRGSPRQNQGPSLQQQERDNRDPHDPGEPRSGLRSGPKSVVDAGRGPKSVVDAGRGPKSVVDAGRGPKSVVDAGRGPKSVVDAGGGPKSVVDAGRGPKSVVDAGRGPKSVVDAGRGPKSVVDAGRGPKSVVDAGRGPKSVVDAGRGPKSVVDAGRGPKSVVDAGRGPKSVVDAGRGPKSVVDAGRGPKSVVDAGGGPKSIVDAGRGPKTSKSVLGTGRDPKRMVGAGRDKFWKDEMPRSPTQDKGQDVPTSPVAPKAESGADASTSSVASESTLPDHEHLLELNQSVDVIVSHIDSPQSFWVQGMEQLKSVYPVLSQAFAVYTGRGTPATSAGMGEMFVCEFLGELARAQVVDVADNSVKIFYVDYGNTEDTEVSHLLPLPEEIASLPPLSMHCALQVAPCQGEEWPAEAIAQLREKFLEQACTITPLRKAGPITEVALVRHSGALDGTEFLIENGLGVAQKAEPAPHSTTQQRVMVASVPSVTQQLRVGQRVNVVFLDTTGPTDIFIRICSLEKAFQDFSATMVANYNDSPEIPYIPVVGELVVGRFSVDKSWYRAEVLEIAHEKKEASLFYVDFGNREQLPFQELRALKPEFAATPIHGFRCAVGGICAPAGGQWRDEDTAVYITCLQKYLMQEEDIPSCCVLVESVADKVVWVDVVSEQLQQSLSEDLSHQLEGTLLQPPIEPQVLPTCPPPSSTPTLVRAEALPIPGLQESSPSPGLHELSPMPGLQESSLMLGLQEFLPTPRPQELSPTPRLQESSPTPGLQESPPTPGLQESSPTPGLQESPPTPGLQESPPTPGLQESPPTPGLQESSPTPGLQESSPTPGLQESSPTPRLQESPPMLGLSLSESQLATAPQVPTRLEVATLSLSPLCVVVCGIQEIVSCQEFYVNRKEAEDELNVLREKLNCFCEGDAGAQPEACKTVSQGDLVLVQFSADCEWYRGRVERVFDDGITCTVFFLDYGNAECKAVSTLKVLPPQFMKLPAQAIMCKLAGVPPPVSEEVEVRFKSTCLQTEVGIKAVGKQEDGYFVEVITADNRSITGILGINSQRKASQRQPVSSLDDRCLPSASDGCLSPVTSVLATPVTVGAASALLDQKSSVAVDPLSAMAGLQQRPSPGPRRSCLQQAAREAEVMDSVVVMYAVSPSHFYAMGFQHYAAQHQEGGLVPELQAVNSLSQPLTTLPQVGDLLSGLFDGQWFRCEVTEVKTSKIHVSFLDYGNEAMLDLSDLRPLPRDLCDRYPLATFRCSIYGISPPSGDGWDEDTVLFFKGLLDTPLFSLTVKAEDSGVCHVVLTSCATGEDVAQKLLDSGRALPHTPIHTNPEKEALLRQMQELQAKLAAM